MNILILGAGQVGSNLARYLCTNSSNDITIIDQKEFKLKLLQRHLDIKTIIGNGSYPSVLEKAGIRKMDMVISVMKYDESNMVACRIAHTIYNVKNKIARVRNVEYLHKPELFSKSTVPIDFLITPEKLITKYIHGIVKNPGIAEIFEFENGSVQLIETQIYSGAPIVNKPVIELQNNLPDIQFRIFSIYRNNEVLLVDKDTIIRAGDHIYFIAETKNISKILREFRRIDNKYKKIFIAGGGNIGFSVAKLLEEKHNIVVIEIDEDRAIHIANNLNRALVLQGNASDEELLEDERIENVDLFLALTDSDEVNVIVSVLAKKLGVHKTIALIKRDIYSLLAEQRDDVDVIVSPDQITVSDILSYLRKDDMMQVHSIKHGKAEAIEIIINNENSKSKVIGRQIKELNIPEGVVVGAIIRDKKLLMASKSKVIKEGDRVLIMLTDATKINEVRSLFV